MQDAGRITITSSERAEVHCICDNSKRGVFVAQLKDLLAACIPRLAFNIRRGGKNWPFSTPGKNDL